MSTLSNLISLECAMGHCSTALLKGGELVEELIITERNQQTRELVPMVETLMRSHKLRFDELDGIATSSGPGSFTGIRIGLATAQALSYAALLPFYTLTTLELLAWQAFCANGKQTGHIISVINAYRGEAYVQSFSASDRLHAESPAQLIKAEQLGSYMPQDNAYLLAGDGATLLEAQHIAHPPAAEAAQTPSAGALAEYVAFSPPPPTERGTIEPFYLREPDAKPQAAFGAKSKSK